MLKLFFFIVFIIMCLLIIVGFSLSIVDGGISHQHPYTSNSLLGVNHANSVDLLLPGKLNLLITYFSNINL